MTNYWVLISFGLFLEGTEQVDMSRVLLASIKKRHLKQIADQINDFLNDQNSQFVYNQWYLIALDIIETKLFKEPKEIMKKYISKYRCNLTFQSKAFDLSS